MPTAKRLPSGSWRVRAYIGKDESGKPKYKSFTGADKRSVEREAAAYADEHRCALNSRLFINAANDYINSKSNVLSPTTIMSYKQILRSYFDTWQEKSVDAIDSKTVQAFINEKSQSLSPKTVRNIYGFITAVIYYAEPSKRLNVTLPKQQKKFKELPPPEDIFKAVVGTECELPVLLAMWLSLRMSEIRGLRYSDITGNILTVHTVKVKAENGDIIKNSTKTYNSARRLSVPAYIMNLINAQPHEAPDDFIITLTHPQIYKRFQKALQNACLPHIRFHDLRHLNASIMLRLGVPDKYAMERGGWSSTGVLKGIYQHTFTRERLETDKKIDDYFNSICHEI